MEADFYVKFGLPVVEGSSVVEGASVDVGSSVVVGGSGVGDSVVITVVESTGVVVVSTKIMTVLLGRTLIVWIPTKTVDYTIISDIFMIQRLI